MGIFSDTQATFSDLDSLDQYKLHLLQQIIRNDSHTI